MGVWNTTTPAGSDSPREGDDRIRELKIAIQEALQCNDIALGNAGNFPGSSPLTDPEYAYRGHRGTTAQRTALSADVAGFCYDTDLGQLFSYAGGSWNAVSSNLPSGTVMLFYQETAPVGWAEIASPITDYFINATSEAAGDGGSETSTFNNVGSESSHKHDEGTLRFKTGRVVAGGSGTGHVYWYNSSGTEVEAMRPATPAGSGSLIGLYAQTSMTGYTKDGSGDTGTGDSHTHSHNQGDHAYANVIICEKD